MICSTTIGKGEDEEEREDKGVEKMKVDRGVGRNSKHSCKDREEEEVLDVLLFS